MKLKKIYFDAFRSLLSKELEITHDCIGLVGTNESGKSNVLTAINILNSTNRQLTLADTPKMARINNPSLRFLFELTDKENKEIENIIKDWFHNNTLANFKSLDISTLQIYYTVTFNKEKNIEERFFTLDGLKLEVSNLILIYDKNTDYYKLKEKDSFIPLSRAVVIKENSILSYKKHQEVYKIIDKINSDIFEREKRIQEAKEKEISINERSKVNEPNVQTPDGQVLQREIDKEMEIIKLVLDEELKKVSQLKKERDALLIQVKGFNINELIDDAKHIIENGEKEIISLKTQITSAQNQIAELKTVTPQDTATIAGVNKTISDLTAKLKSTEENLIKAPKLLEELLEPIENKYTKEITELNKFLSTITQPLLISFLPKVVFWEHSPNYILRSETLFSELLNKKDLNEISRPLVNVFRIGFHIKTLDELKTRIKEIQTDSSERTRYQETLDEKINEYISGVWADYDQEVKISLEKDQIRIQIYDPNRKGASL